MKKLKSLLSLSVIIIITCLYISCNNEETTPNQLTLDQQLKTTTIRKVKGDKNLIQQKIYSNPEEYGFKNTSNKDSRFNKNNTHTFYIRQLPNENEEFIMIKNESKKNRNYQNKSGSRGLLVCSDQCICADMARAYDLEKIIDDKCTETGRAGINTLNITGGNGENVSITGDWISSSYMQCTISADSGELHMLERYIDDIPDGWIQRR
ncbi:hypothetical protein [Flavobacterium sp. '19STA2R22 D10 B1']|uniref:hypothetical protein n=1 Tax=Flavobacterium aerium TaxID=3037261 RepID=UPI00278BD7E4|nr:hypothetical protein [Flavobacterium sp. '19STA2R22 D10 B1']